MRTFRKKFVKCFTSSCIAFDHLYQSMLSSQKSCVKGIKIAYDEHSCTRVFPSKIINIVRYKFAQCSLMRCIVPWRAIHYHNFLSNTS